MRRSTLDQQRELDVFLASVERRAYRMAELATGNKDEALDILQDAMFKLVERYAEKPAEEWGPLFTTILQSRIKDWYRRQQVRKGILGWFGTTHSDTDLIQQAEDKQGRSPEQHLVARQRTDVLEQALRALPVRQQQVFLLRNWEGLSVDATARAMKISTGSVKTHYSRALQSLRTRLGKYREQE
ncbi:MAG: RNA polymerase sigma factor [Gammaproteobacteria bacterium]